MSINSKDVLIQYLFYNINKEKEINEMLEEMYDEPKDKDDNSFERLLLLVKNNYPKLYNYWKLKIL